MYFQHTVMFSFRFGLDGKACVERLVCEINSNPMNIGLIGDIINTIFL